MSDQIDYDADLARRLDVRLAGYVPVGRITRPARDRSRIRLAAAISGGTLAIAAVAGAFEVNAYADSQGLSCADAMLKIQLFGASIADQVRGASIEEQRAAKQRVIEYGMPLMTEGCGGAFEKNPNGTVDWNPRPSPSGAVPQQSPVRTFDPSRTPKPTNALPSPTGRP